MSSLSSQSDSAPSPSQSEKQLRFAAILAFTVMGFHVGVYAVQLAPLAHALGLTVFDVGLVGTVSSLVGVVVRASLGRFTDRFGRHIVLAFGFGGTAFVFVAIAAVSSLLALYVALIGYGLCACWMDIGANTLGAEVERATRRRSMNGLQAGFSAGACVGALGAAVILSLGIDYRAVYGGLAIVLALCACLLLTLRLPQTPKHTTAPSNLDGEQTRRVSLWRNPLIVFGIVVLTVTFFGDGALESFLSVYMNATLGAAILLAGVGVALFHAASLLGRLLAHATLNRFGERRVVFSAGLLASAGIVLAVVSPTPEVAIAGLLITGFAEAPLVPLALSLVGSAIPHRTGEAVSLATSVGFSAFIASPIIVGGIAQATDLRVGLALVALTLLTVAILGLRWPRHQLSSRRAAEDCGTSPHTPVQTPPPDQGRE